MPTEFYPTTASGTHYNTNRNSRGITRKGLEDAYKTMDRDGKKAEAWAQKIFRPNKSNVSNQNPTAAGGPEYTTGKEKANHKYIKKVKTKSGKIRYIYDAPTMEDIDRKTKRYAEEAARRARERDMADARARRKKREHEQRMKTDIPYRISHDVNAALDAGRKFVDDVMYSVRNSPLGDLFK